MADLFLVTLGCDETTSLTSLSWCNSRSLNSTHHCYYTMASADAKFDDFICSVFNLSNKNVNVTYQEKMTGQRGRLSVQPLGYVMSTKVILSSAVVFVLAEVCLPRRPHADQTRSDV